MREAFLDFLVLQGLVDPELSQALLRAPLGAAEPIGRLALEHGMITGGDIDRVLRLQRKSHAPFGEIACDLEVLTPPQLGRLLEVQRMRVGYELVETLILGGVLDAEEAWSAFARFLLENGVPTRASSPPA